MKDNGLEIVYVSVDELRPSEYNPRRATDKEYDDVRRSIERFGLVDPIIVNGAENRKNVVIGGHLRLKVAKELGIKEVPVVYVNIPDVEKEKELLLRLNKNTGSWDWDMLANFDEGMLLDIGFQKDDLLDLFIVEPEPMIEKKEARPYRYFHILISIPYEVLSKVYPMVEQLLEVLPDECEIEKTSN